MIRVLVVDDHALFRSGVRALIDTIDAAEVVGEAASGAEAVAAATDLQPDLVLLDLEMPGGSGLDAIPGLRSAAPGAAILVLTMRDDEPAVRTALRAGARGYLLKDLEPDELVGAISMVARGDTVIGRDVADRLAELLGRSSDARSFPDLTDSERATLRLMSLGRTNAEIAGELYLSVKTVQNYVSRIFVKLAVADRAQAIVAAREAGLHTEAP
jgi:DNA-binding NarL/FixJ family response regulator